MESRIECKDIKPIVIILAQDRLSKRCCSIADPQVGTIFFNFHERESWVQSEENWPVLMKLGMCCLILPCSLWDIRSTYRLLQWHEN